MIDIFVMFGVVVLGYGGFVALYLAWIFILARLSQISFKEALKWWDD